MLNFKVILFIIVMVTVSACSATGNTANDANSAQRLLPNLAAYNANDVDTAIDGAFTAAGGAALAGGQIQVTAAVAKAEQVLQCFQDRGAVAAKFYNEKNPSGIIPKVGAVLVINQTRINQELLNCALGGQEGFSSQSVAVEPCTGSDTFTYQGDSISYIYVGSDPAICGLYDTHFNNLKTSS